MTEGNVFTLSTTGGRGREGDTLSPFHNTSNWSHVLLLGGRGLPHVHLKILTLVSGPFPRGIPQPDHIPSQDRGVPQSGQDGVPPYPQPGLDVVLTLGQDWMGYSPLVQDWMGYPPPPGQVMLAQVTARAVHLLRFPAGKLSCFKMKVHVYICVAVGVSQKCK